MNSTPSELLAPYKALLAEAARDLLRASGGAGVAFEILGSVPPSVIVIGEEAEVGKLLREPMGGLLPGGRRAGDPPPAALSWEEPMPGAPRKWTILMTSAGHGLVGALGSKFEHADERHERVDVVELNRFADQLATAIEQNAQHIETVQQLRAQVAELSAALQQRQAPAQAGLNLTQLDAIADLWGAEDTASGWVRQALREQFRGALAQQTEAGLAHEGIGNMPCPGCDGCPEFEAEATPAPTCWSCNRPYTMEQRSEADGNCPHCGVEIELDDAEEGGAS